MDRALLIVVFVLKKSIVALAVSSSHLDSSHSCTIGHVADHT